jgi:hypothetical protein
MIVMRTMTAVRRGRPFQPIKRRNAVMNKQKNAVRTALDPLAGTETEHHGAATVHPADRPLARPLAHDPAMHIVDDGTMTEYDAPTTETIVFVTTETIEPVTTGTDTVVTKKAAVAVVAVGAERDAAVLVVRVDGNIAGTTALGRDPPRATRIVRAVALVAVAAPEVGNVLAASVNRI